MLPCNHSTPSSRLLAQTKTKTSAFCVDFGLPKQTSHSEKPTPSQALSPDPFFKIPSFFQVLCSFLLQQAEKFATDWHAISQLVPAPCPAPSKSKIKCCSNGVSHLSYWNKFQLRDKVSNTALQQQLSPRAHPLQASSKNLVWNSLGVVQARLGYYSRRPIKLLD